MLTRTRNKAPRGVLVPSHTPTSLIVNASQIAFGSAQTEGKIYRYFCWIYFSDEAVNGYIDTDVDFITTWRKRQIDQPAVQLEWSAAGIAVVRVQLKGQWYDFKSTSE